MSLQLRAKGLRVTSQSRKGLLFKTCRHCQGHVEAVVKVTDVFMGPWMFNNLASMCVLPVLPLPTACSFYPLTNTKWSKRTELLPHPVCPSPKSQRSCPGTTAWSWRRCELRLRPVEKFPRHVWPNFDRCAVRGMFSV